MMKEFKFLLNKMPYYVILYPTSRCNATCPHCFNYGRQYATRPKDELTLEEIEKISKNMEHVKVLTITGGEPFLREDLVDIVGIFHKNNGVQYVSYHTNGFFTERILSAVRESLERFKDVNFILCTSIDGIGKEHDEFRGTPKGFDKLLKTTEQLNALKKEFPRLSLISCTSFSHSTQHSCVDTVRYISEKIGGFKPSLCFIRGDVRNNNEKKIDHKIYENFYKNFLAPKDFGLKPFSSMAIKQAMEMMTPKIVLESHKKGKEVMACQAGSKLVVIYETGDVHPCESFPQKFGNLRDVDYDIKKLLFTEKGNAIRAKIKQKCCSATWENIIPVNMMYSPRFYPALAREWLKLFPLRGLHKPNKQKALA